MNKSWQQRLGVQAGLAFAGLGLVACSQTVRVPGHLVMQPAAPAQVTPSQVASEQDAPNQVAQLATLTHTADSATPINTNTASTSTSSTTSTVTPSPKPHSATVVKAPTSITSNAEAATPLPPSSLAGFHTGAAEVLMEVEPASKQVREFMIKQADTKLVLPLEDARWQRGSIVLQLREHHGSLRLNWLDDSAPFDRITHESCTYSGYCEHDVEVEEEHCRTPLTTKAATNGK